MPLQSKFFRANDRLQMCLVSDPHHVLEGARGDFVILIQVALESLDGASISDSEVRENRYGPSTAKAVLAYKTKRRIINFRYQTSPDNVVGKMTIQSLDSEMLAQETQHHTLLLGFGFTPNSKVAVLTETRPGCWLSWTNQLKAAYGDRLVVVPVGTNPPVVAAADALKRAINAADGGFLILSVGHGHCPDQADPSSGVFDLAPDGVMKISGRQSTLEFASVFYDEKKEKPFKSGKEADEDIVSGKFGGASEATRAFSKQRLANWDVYMDIAAAANRTGLAGVLLVTCKVGRAHVMLQRFAKQWNTHVFAYRRFMGCQVQTSGRARTSLFEENRTTPDAETNVAFNEVMFPISMNNMVHLAP